MTTSEFKAQCMALVEAAQHIVITAHISPDDDSIGSVLLMHRILSDQYPHKQIRIVYTGTAVDRYGVFEGFEAIEWVGDVADQLDGVEVLITVDASNFSRFSKKPERLAAVPVRIGLDHHASTPDDYTLLLKDESQSSNTELIYRVFLEGAALPQRIAEYILLGVLGDTGNFSYVKPSHAQTLLLGKTLLEAVGMPIDQFRSRYGGIPKRVLPLLQELVKNTQYVSIAGWPPGQYSYIDRSMMDEGKYTDEEMSAASHIYMGQYLPRIQGYEWGFVVTPRSDGGCRQSARSLPTSVNVRVLHEQLGIGSGHDRAAGGHVTDNDPQAWIIRELDWMKANQPLIG